MIRPSRIIAFIETYEQSLLDEIEALRADRDYWKDRYWKETFAAIKHNEEMFGHVLKATLEAAGEKASKEDKGLSK